MGYFFLFLAVLLTGLGFIFNKIYQMKLVDSKRDIWIYPIFTACIGFVMYFIINGFSLSFGKYSFIMACLYGFLCLTYSIIGIFAIRIGKLSVYTMFLMIGGMLLPYIYGVLYLNEKLTVYRIIGMVVLIGSLIFNSLVANEKNENKPKPLFWILCIVVFILNGCVSITSKTHQINPSALGTNDFLMWVYLFQIVSSLVVYFVYILFIEPKDVKPEIKKMTAKKFFAYIGLAGGFAVGGGIGSFFILNMAKSLPATALYPFITGGTTIVTAIMARLFFKEKITKLSGISLLLMLGGTILFMF